MPINSFDHYPLSWKPDKEKLTKPYYLSLTKDLEQRIRSGELLEGTKLPPQRELADYLDLNYTTITRVYNRVKKKGLIYGIVGRGTFVAPKESGDITIAERVMDKDIIELSFVSGFSEYSAPVVKALRRVAKKSYAKKLLDYSCIRGHPHHLAAGNRWLSQMGVHTNPEHMCIFSGAENALTVALCSLFHRGDTIAVDEYTYSNFIELAHMLSLQLIPVKGDDHGMKPDALLKVCRKSAIQGIYLMPNGANPTNIQIPLSRRKELAKIIAHEGLTLIEDDLYGWLHGASGSPIPPLFEELQQKAFYICGTAKNLCPGLRIAYTAYTDDLKGAVLHGVSNMNIKTSSLDAEVITELILSGDAYPIVHHKMELAKEACRLFDSIFPGVQEGVISYFRWLPLPRQEAYDIVEKELYQRGVHIYHSGRFQVGPESSQDYLRISLCSAGSMKKLQKGLLIVKEYMVGSS